MTRVGSIVFFRCSSTEVRPAMITAMHGDDAADLIVFVTPDDAFLTSLAVDMFDQDELAACSAFRRSVPRSPRVEGWLEPN